MACFEKSLLKSTLFHQTDEIMEEFSAKCEHLLLGFNKLCLPASCGCLSWRLEFLVWQEWVHHRGAWQIFVFGRQDHIAPILQKLRNILNESVWMVLPIVCVRRAGKKWEILQVNNISIPLGTRISTLLTSFLYTHAVGFKEISLISFRVTGSHVRD